MLKKIMQMLTILLASLFCQTGAFAQTADTQFTYVQKSQTISLAKTGSADAYFQLGLSHLHGLNSVQNEKIAERFFHYAAQKGHVGAQQQLSLLNIKTINGTSAPSQTFIAERTKNTADLNRGTRNAAPTNSYRNTHETFADNAQSTLKLKQPAIAEQAVPNEQKVLGALVDNKAATTKTLIDDPLVLPNGKETIKLAANTSQQSLTASVARPQSLTAPKTLPHVTPKRHILLTVLKYLITIAAIVVITFIAYTLAAQRFNWKTIFPADFSKKAYLEFNPDVAASGVNVVLHYIMYGRHEARTYKY